MNYDELKILDKAKSVCLISHYDPDIDAINSLVVFRRFLLKTFNIKRIDIFASPNGELTDECKRISKGENLNPKPTKYDYAIILDCTNYTKERIDIYNRLINNVKKIFVIDHHDTNNFAGDINFVEITSSTCEIIYYILEYFNYKFTKDDLERIYSGIITDTNNFSVGSYNSKTFYVASKCIDLLQKDELYNRYFNNYTIKNMQIFALAINNSKIFNKNILISSISYEEKNKYNIINDDYLGIVNRLRTIKGIKVACFIYPKQDNNEYYISLRTSGPYDVSVVAKLHGGGGHKGAAAFNSKENIDKIIENILPELQDILKKK